MPPWSATGRRCSRRGRPARGTGWWVAGLVGGGEWVTAGLAHDNPNLDYTIPKQGGVRWQQGLSIFAGSKDKGLATKFVQYILSHEAQGKLATASCYWGMPANSKAVLTADQKTILRWSDQPTYIRTTVP